VKLRIGRTAITAAFLAASGTSGLAFAVNEIEPNGTIAEAQAKDKVLTIGSDGTAEVTGAIGSPTGILVADVDFFAFRGCEGNVVTIDIDGGMKPRFSGLRSVDTIVALFGLGGRMLAQNTDAELPIDAGSTEGQNGQWDARIDNFTLPATGLYTIGVSSQPRTFQDGGTLSSNTLGSNSNGTYTLLISGVKCGIRIDAKIKLGGTPEDGAPVNPRSKGNIPVSLLSSPEFDTPEVDQQSLRFGARGDEASWLRCNKADMDMNADGKPDLVCHFDTQTAAFDAGSIEGIVTGSLKDGRRFEGRSPLKIVPVKQ
jgi:hypothetical protein